MSDLRTDLHAFGPMTKQSQRAVLHSWEHPGASAQLPLTEAAEPAIIMKCASLSNIVQVWAPEYNRAVGVRLACLQMPDVE